MWSLRRPAHLSLCLLAALVDVASVSVNGSPCASPDNGGGMLDNTFIDSSINGVHFDLLLCTYFDGASCAYSSDGSFNVGQSTDPDNVCPGSQAAATSSSTHSTPSQTETPQTPSHPLTTSSYQHPIHDVTYRHQHSTAVSNTLSEIRKQLAVAKAQPPPRRRVLQVHLEGQAARIPAIPPQASFLPPPSLQVEAQVQTETEIKHARPQSQHL
ncbi:hypothetical protein B0H14DRAFT_1233114 [Mycena olivaceomarginata]|nr:hypothetical protein B0H14DRAFT_1233114 [Mycena olivaceomarginata]